MSYSSSGSSQMTSGRTSHGIPTKCWCGESIVIYTSTTKDNPGRRFYRCAIALQRKKEHHLFHWVDEALAEEMKMIDMNYRKLGEDVKDLRKNMLEMTELHKTMVENLKPEMKKHMSEMVEKELTVAKERMEKMGQDIAYLTLKKVGVVVVVFGVLAWLCGRIVSY